MLKAMARTDKGAMILIGLSHANVDRLMAGQPILFPGSAIGMGGTIAEIAIFVGKDEEEMRAELDKRGLIGDETTVINEPKGAEHIRRPGGMPS